jgi:hypothetical protein
MHLIYTDFIGRVPVAEKKWQNTVKK